MAEKKNSGRCPFVARGRVVLATFPLNIDLITGIAVRLCLAHCGFYTRWQKASKWLTAILARRRGRQCRLAQAVQCRQATNRDVMVYQQSAARFLRCSARVLACLIEWEHRGCLC
jgi:hypothetical protein